MKNVIVSIILVVIGVSIAAIAAHGARAADAWFCSEDQQSERRGNEILACGRGYNRDVAYHNAVIEFHRICDISADCVNHPVIVTPMRVQKIIHRKPNKKGHKLTYIRMLAFEIQPLNSSVQ